MLRNLNRVGKHLKSVELVFERGFRVRSKKHKDKSRKISRADGKKRKRSTRQDQERTKKYKAGPRANKQKKNYEAGQRIKNLGEKKGEKRDEAGPKKERFFEKQKSQKKN